VVDLVNGLVSARDSSIRKTATWLGWGGLLPFFGLPVAMAIYPSHQALCAQTLAAYSLGIICFLLGTWWGLTLIRRHTSALLMSNGFFLVTFASYILHDLQTFFMTSALLFIVLLLIERRHALFREQPVYYARLRALLSVTASLSLVCAATIMY
jgi:hypothetical protein